MRSNVVWIGGLTLALAGCGDRERARSMRGELEALDRHVAEVRVEVDVHASAIGAVASLESAMAEETRHHGAIHSHTDSMEMVMGDMGSCHDGMGDPPDTMPMHESMEDMLEECDDHLAVMGSAGNMGEVGTEEQWHQSVMGAMLDSMESLMGSMMDHAGDYDCSGGMTGSP